MMKPQVPRKNRRDHSRQSAGSLKPRFGRASKAIALGLRLILHQFGIGRRNN